MMSNKVVILSVDIHQCIKCVCVCVCMGVCIKFKFKSQTQKFRPETNTLDMKKQLAQKLSLEKTDT